MDYKVVFDVASAGYKSWDFPAHGLILVGVGVILISFRKRLPGWWGKHPRVSNVFTFFYFGFAVFWTLISFFSTYHNYTSLAEAEKANSVSVVEGVVTNFKPMPVTGHAMEKFCVSGACFEYSDYVITGGFNNTSSHGGPIREGLPVRVTYVRNAIIKLEVVK